MKTLYFFLSLLVVSFSLSGCAIKGTYTQDYISKEVNPYYSKVATKTITMIEDKSVYTRSSDSWQGKAPLELEVGNINNKVQEEFFKQYFAKTVLVKNRFTTSTEDNIVIESTVNDFRYYISGFDNVDMTIELTVKVSYKNNTILEKQYTIKDNNKVLFRIGVVTGKEGTIELFHKSLLNFYETKFKKDFLEALSN